MVGMEAAALSAAVTGTLKIVCNKLAPLVMKEYSSIVGVKKDLEELQDLAQEIICQLERAGDRATGDAPWLKKLKEVVYDVDNVVDEFQLKAEKHNADGGFMSRYLHKKTESFIFQCKAARKIKKIKKRFAEIVKQRTDLTAIFGHDLASHINNTAVNMQTLPIENEPTILGRNQEMQQIVSHLVETSNKHEIKIVSIVGLGGSGKTTLSKLVFNDDKTIHKHFEVRLWVHLSHEYHFEKFIKKLFEAFADKDLGQPSLPYMSKKIQEGLTKKKFLIVMDDVWIESQNQWEQIMGHLKLGAPGSAILLTTRNINVAITVRSTYKYCLPRLSPDDSWQLFQQSFRIPMKPLESDFIKVGKEIVETCCGLPLAIKVLAGSLGDKELIGEWQATRDILLEVGGEESVSACLTLSYFHLPSHLKKCFTRCSLFPKGHMIYKQQLIDQWIADDMISLTPGVDDLEHIGDRYFSSLVQVFFLEDVTENNGRVSCKMHDLVHDLARFILHQEIATNVPEHANSSTNGYRYLSLIEQPRRLLHKKALHNARAIFVDQGNDYIISSKALKNAKHLRSIIVNSNWSKENHLHSIVVNSGWSRETFLCGMILNPNSLTENHSRNSIVNFNWSTPLLKAIVHVKNLKYLEMSHLQCKALPESISDIWSLQAVHLTYSGLLELPKSFGKLQQLRSLNLSHSEKLKCLPDSIGDCNMLSSIDLCNCKKLIALPNSIGRNKKLRVLRLGFTKIEMLPSSVTTLKNLENLDLHCCWELVKLPEGINNLEKLQVLNLRMCIKLIELPEGIINLEKLQVLNLENCIRLVELPEGMDNLEKLQVLRSSNSSIQWMTHDAAKMNIELEKSVPCGMELLPRIKKLDIHRYLGTQYAQWMQNQVGGRVQGLAHFPFLRVMKLYDFPNLKHLHGLVELPCLEELVLQAMPSLESLSGGPFPSLVKFIMKYLPSLGEVWIVPEKTISDEEEGGSCRNCTPQSRQFRVGNCVTYLHINGCPKLKVKPYLPFSLQQWYLSRSGEQLLQSPGQCGGCSSSSSFSHLKNLNLSWMKKLGSGHGWELLRHMTALESLSISFYEADLLEGLGSLTSLRSLKVHKCCTMHMLPECLGELHCLQKLIIQSCYSLSSLPKSMCGLTSLERLRIRNCTGLTSLPQGMKGLVSLEELIISGCPGIKTLPEDIYGLTTLKKLWISRCPGMKSLPEGNKMA